MKLRIVNTKKFVRSLILLFLGLYLSSLMITGSLYSNGDVRDYYISYRVAQGDTLWSIAKANTPNTDDTRGTLSQIIAYNALTTDTIYSGQMLFIPSEPEVNHE